MAAENENTLRVSLTVGQASFEAEGPVDQVRELYDQFHSNVEEKVATSAGKGRASSGRQGPDGKSLPPADEGNGHSLIEEDAAKLPLSAFADLFELENHAERAGVVAVWLRYHEEVVEFAPADVEKWWKRGFKGAAPKNFSRELRKAETDGLVSTLGYGKYGATDYADEVLEQKRSVE